MRDRARRLMATAGTTGLAACAGLAAGLAAAPAAEAAQRYALLVGVTDYPALDERMWLHGPANDVALMEQVLLQQGFTPDAITVLSQGETSEGEPTRAAILGAIDGLIDTVAPGDFVYLHFGGHGSQQPAAADAGELDGFDEIFLPSDVGPWDGRQGTVTNAIVDDELQPRIAALREAGAFVFAVFDSCHSGTMLRAVNAGEMDRRLDPSLLGIPQDAIAAAQAAAVHTRGGAAAVESILDGETARGGGDASLGGYVAFYAAQTTETTPELRLPAGDPNRQTYGLFSYTLASVFAAHPGITYRQAAQQVLVDYVADNRNAPTPLFESDGVSLDAVLLSGTPADEVRQWPVAEDRGGWRIPAGRLNQLDQGAVLAVYPDALAGPDDAPLGYVEVDSAQIVHSIVLPVAYGDLPAMDEIPEGAFARLVDAHYSVALAVALPEQPAEADPTDAPAWAVLDRLIDEGLDQVAITWVPGTESADLRLHIADGRLWLLPPSGEMSAASAYLTIPEDGNAIAFAEFEEDLEDNLRKVARVNALFSLADQLASTAIGRELTVDLSVQRRDGTVEAFALGDFPALADGDVITFAVTNSSNQVVDLTALFIDSQFGIEPWFPYQGESNRMNPGETLSSQLEVNVSTVGVERFLFIAAGVQPGAPRADFSFLAQAGLTTRALGTSGLSGATIADVLADAGVDVAATRGGGRPAMSLATMSSFSWTVIPDQ
ncbi:MAG: caspase family protein [Alphaproteobacteria bacterium]